MSHVPIPSIGYLSEEGVLAPSYKVNIAVDTLLKGYRVMVLTRHVDERMITLQRQGMITFAMSALGEEACSVASAAALQIEDWMYPQYREAGVLFWRGYTPLQYIHHMFGDREDPILGRQMPNHFGARDLNVVTVSSPIGTKIPHAAGCAYGMLLQKEKSVVITYFGEGATSEGDFHAGVNFAAVLKAPVIFFCRNNGYAISTPCCEQFASDGVAPKGTGYGIPAYRVDGNDFFAVHDVVAQAKKMCLDQQGPVLIEAMTYRLGAHSTSDDPSVYRDKSEEEKWRKKCPILRLRRYLEKQGLWSEEQETKLIATIKEQVTQAISIAKKTEKPPISYLIEHVYDKIPKTLQQQYDALLNDNRSRQ